MYETTREQAANILWISTRSVDRYIRWGKLRAKKVGKIVYIHAQDIQSFSGNTNQEVLTEIPKIQKESLSEITSRENDIGKIFTVLQQQIEKKDIQIQNLNIEIGRMQESLKNSVSLGEFRKSQFLLESGKNHLTSELQNAQIKIQEQKETIKEEKIINTALFVICAILFVTSVVLFFVKL